MKPTTLPTTIPGTIELAVLLLATGGLVVGEAVGFAIVTTVGGATAAAG